MKFHGFPLLCLTTTVLSINLIACGSVQQMIQGTPTSTPTDTPTMTPTFTLTPTNTLTPTSTSTPTSTPDIVATQKTEEFFEIAQAYFDEIFLEIVYGEYYLLPASVQNLAQVDYIQWETYRLEARNFLLRTNVKMATDEKPSNTTGCGVVFRAVGSFTEAVIIQQNGNLYYSAGDTNFNTGYFERLDNPAEFELVVTLNEKAYQVYINGKKALTGDSILDPSKGEIGFIVQSGSNEGFGSQCKFTNSDFWIIKKK